MPVDIVLLASVHQQPYAQACTARCLHHQLPFAQSPHPLFLCRTISSTAEFDASPARTKTHAVETLTSEQSSCSSHPSATFVRPFATALLTPDSLSSLIRHMLFAGRRTRSSTGTCTLAFKIDVSRRMLPMEESKLCIYAANKRADLISKTHEKVMFAEVSRSAGLRQCCMTLQRGQCGASCLRTEFMMLLYRAMQT